MPKVIVTRDPSVMDDDAARLLGADLPRIVAEALGCEEGPLIPTDVWVTFRDVGPLDVNAPPFAVEVIANEFPARRANLDRRADLIASELREHPAIPAFVIDGKGGFVWVRIMLAEFELL